MGVPAIRQVYAPSFDAPAEAIDVATNSVACMVDANDTPGNRLFIFDRGYESLNLMT